MPPRFKRKASKKYSKRSSGKRTQYGKGYGRVATAPLFVSRTLGNPLAITEHKYKDMAVGGINVLSVVALGDLDVNRNVSFQLPSQSLFGPGQGTGAQQVVGRKVWLNALRIRGTIRKIPAASTQAVGTLANDSASMPTNVRLVVVQDTQTNQTIGLSTGQVFGSKSAFVAAYKHFHDPQLIDNLGRFKVRYDKVLKLDEDYTAVGNGILDQRSGGVKKAFKINLRFGKGIMINYTSPIVVTAAGGLLPEFSTPASVVDNSFYLFAWHDNAGILAGGIDMDFISRAVFMEGTGGG